MLSRISLVLAFFLLAPARLAATIVIAVWTPAALYVGADSRAIARNFQPLGPICKIRTAGDIVYSYAGVLQFQELIDVPKLFREAYESDDGRDDITVIAHRFGMRLAVALTKARERVLQRPARDRRIFPEAGQLVVLGVKNGTGAIQYYETSIKGQDYSVSDDGRAVLGSTVTALKLPSEPLAKMQFLFAGERQEALEYMSLHPELKDGDPVNAITTLVSIAQKAHPLTVGGPISILKMNNDGSRKWEVGGMCVQP